MDFLFGRQDILSRHLSYILSVSILVLVDFLFGPAQELINLRNAWSFNPCFGGFPFRTLGEVALDVVAHPCFNPCFGGFPFRTAVFLWVILRFEAFYQSFIEVVIVIVSLLTLL